MTAPSVSARAGAASSTSNATTFTATLPTITANKGLLVAVAAKGAVTLSVNASSVGEWYLIDQASQSTNVTLGLFWCPQTVGGESLVVTSSASTQFSNRCEMVDGGGGNLCIAIGSTRFASASSTNPNPPANDTLKARDLPVIEVVGISGTVVPTAASTSFSNLNTTAGGGASGAGTATAEQTLTATQSNDPAVMTMATAPWVAATVAIWIEGNPLQTFIDQRDRGTGNVVVFGATDSMGAGWSANAVSSGTTVSTWVANPRANAIFTKLAAGLKCMKGSADSFIGDGGAAAAANGSSATFVGGGALNLVGYDTRCSWTTAANWGVSYPTDGTNQGTIGGGAPRANASGQTLSFTPANAFDRIQYLYSEYSGSPQSTVNVDGGSSLGTLPQNNATTQPGSTTLSCTLGTHTVNYVTGGASSYAIGCITWNSAVREMSFINGGWWGSQTSDWNNNVGAGNLPAMRLLAPHLTVIELGANDMLSSVATTTVQQNLRQIALNAKISGSVLMIGIHYVDSVSWGVSAATQDSYRAAIAQVARELNCRWFDITKFSDWVDYATANGNGYIGADHGHASPTGYAAYATRLQAIFEPPPPRSPRPQRNHLLRR